MVSYDVEKLYPSIPISKALELIECLFKGKRDLKSVTTFSIKKHNKVAKMDFFVNLL